MLRINPTEFDFEDELGAIAASVSVSAKAPKGKKKKKKAGSKAKKIFKKIGKAATVIATGGIAAAPMLKKSKAAKKVKKVAAKAKTAVGKVKDLLSGSGIKATVKASIKPTAKKPAPKKAAKLPAIAKAVQNAPLSSCANMEEMAKLVAAKLMVSLGTPLQESRDILQKQDLQAQATYEHQKLMSDADFRRKVLALLTKKAAEGNETCARTVRVILAK